MTAANLLAGIIFSSIGLGAFIYGKKGGHWKATLLGLVLLIYPYFTADAWMTTLIGVPLTAALFLFRD